MPGRDGYELVCPLRKAIVKIQCEGMPSKQTTQPPLGREDVAGIQDDRSVSFT